METLGDYINISRILMVRKQTRRLESEKCSHFTSINSIGSMGRLYTYLLMYRKKSTIHGSVNICNRSMEIRERDPFGEGGVRKVPVQHSLKLTNRHGKSTILMVFTRKDGIFMGYVSFREGTPKPFLFCLFGWDLEPKKSGCPSGGVWILRDL